jgi:hypothetical protein
LLNLYKSLDNTKIENLDICYDKFFDDQSSSIDDFSDFRFPELKSLHVFNENKHNSTLISKNTNLQKLLIYNFESSDYFLKVIEAIKSNQLLKKFKINFILSNAVLVKKLALEIELHKNLEEIEIDYYGDGDPVNIPYFESASSLIHINLLNDIHPYDQITLRYENFSECYEIFVNSFEHNFKITSSSIISVFNHFIYFPDSLDDFTPENKKNIQEVMMPRIEGLNKKMIHILNRNRSFSKELRQDITDFKSGLINKLTLEVDSADLIERVIKVTNAVIDYFVLPIIATDEKSSKLNQIFTEFERQFSDKKQDDLSTDFAILISVIVNPEIGCEEYPPKLSEIIIKNLFSETLNDQLEDRVKFRKNLQDLKLQINEINIIRDYLIDFYCHKQKAITSDNEEQLLSQYSSSAIHEDRKITEITEDSEKSQITSATSVAKIKEPESSTNKRKKENVENYEDTEPSSDSSLFKRIRVQSANLLKSKMKSCIIS